MTNKYRFFNLFGSILIGLFFFPFQTINAQTPCAGTNGVILVSNTQDAGVGSLRDAINCANTTPGPNIINFNLPGFGPHIIFVGSTTGLGLPTLTDVGTIIDASAQTGFGAGGGVVLDGSQTTWNAPIDAILIENTSACGVFGLTIRNFPDDAIDVENSDNCFIGGPNQGNIIYNNGAAQDIFPGFPGSWEGCGVVIKNGSDNCVVQGNIIGTDFTQNLAAGNEYCGVIVLGNCFNSQIGGTQPSHGNVIANNLEGVHIDNSFNHLIRFNQFFCNLNQGIIFTTSGNNNKQPPQITAATTTLIAGTSLIGDLVDVYLEGNTNCQGAPCQGRIYLGTTSSSSGNWQLVGPFANGFTPGPGLNITAISTDPTGTSSTFSPCATLIPGAGSNSCADPNGVILVTNTNDSGTGSLRSAIDCANNTSGPNQIHFNIPGAGPHSIFVGSTTGLELPPLLDGSTVLDATTQPGFGVGGNFAPQIILNGNQTNWQAPINALLVVGNSCEVYGFEILNFPDDGIDVTSGDFCIIGAPNKGNVIYNNGWVQDIFPGVAGSWNGCGIVMKNGASFTTVQGNIIGTNYAQTINVGNEFCGIIVQDGCVSNLIGGNAPGTANIIAYNEVGVLISPTSSSCRIQRNFMYCNSIVGISLIGNGNSFQPAPTIIDGNNVFVSGVATPFATVEVFVNNAISCPNAPCQGSIFLGEIQADANGVWALPAPYANNYVLANGEAFVATATSANNNTSPFSNCFAPNNCVGFSASAFVTANVTCGLANGGLVVIPNGGNGPYLYDIGVGAQSNEFFGSLTSGTYTITIIDVNGCTSNVTATVSSVPGFTSSLQSVVDENCSNQNGSITVGTTGGATPFSFDIGNGFTNSSTFSNLAAGTYVVTVVDGSGCTETISASLNNVNVAFNSPTVQNATCGQSNGSITFSASGAPPYNFDIGNGQTSNNTISGLSAGTYTATVTDNNGCTDTQTVTLSGGIAVQAGFTNIQDENCGQANGAFTVSVTGGNAPFTFDIGTGLVSTPIFNNLTTGNYSVTVTDTDGCTDVQSVTLNSTGAPTFSVNNIVAASCGQINGGFTIVPTSGAAPYTYDNGSGPTSNPQFSNIGSGSYNVVVMDANGCTATQAVTVPANTLVFSIQSISSAACGMINGSVTIDTTVLASPFTFDIGTGATSNNVLSGLAGGNYVVTVSDGNGCTGTEAFTINSSSAVTFSISNIVTASCGQFNGGFTVVPTGGASPYTYDDGSGPTSNPQFSNIGSGAYNVIVMDANGCTAMQAVTVPGNTLAVSITSTSIANCGMANGSATIDTTSLASPFTFDIGTGATSNNVLSGLAGGNYVVTVSDGNGCTSTEAFTINSSTAISFSVSNIVTASCGQFNGGFTVVPIGGTAPYTYDDGSGPTSNPQFSNIGSGAYNVVVMDVNGCTTNQIVNVPGNSTVVNIQSTSSANCGMTNGSVTIDTTNLTSPFTFDIGTGSMSNNVISGLAGGNYVVTVSDANGCTSTEAFTINSNTAVSFSISNNNAAACGQNNGSFTVVPSGGTAPYTYDDGSGPTSNPQFSNLSGGVYSVVVTDVNGCTASQTVTINSFGNVTISISNITNASCSQTNGSFTVNATGTGPLTYNFGNGPTSNNVFSNIGAGTYNVMVTDSLGCSGGASVTLSTTNGPQIVSGDVIPADCGQANGAISITVSGGTPGYTYDIGNGPNSNNVISNLSAGTYNATVTDVNGCSDMITVTVNEMGNTPIAGFLFTNSSLTVSFSNTSTNVNSYLWDFGDGNTSTLISPTHVYSSAGTYNTCLTVTNSCGSDTHCETYTLVNTGSDPLIFEIAELSGGIGDIISIPVTVQNFDDIVLFQKSITMTDTSVAEFIGVSNLNLTFLNQGSFNVTLDNISVVWLDNSGIGQTVPTGTVLYTIDVLVKNNIACSDIVIGNAPTPIQVVKKINGNDVMIGHQAIDGEICALASNNLPVDIGGEIAKENSQTVANVDVSCTSTNNYMTVNDGLYHFLNMTYGNTYTVTPFKDDNPTNGVTGLDMVLIQQHILGTSQLSSPYQIIAADANNSGAITTIDLAVIQSVILGNNLQFPNNTSWRFVPEDYIFTDPTNPFADNFPESITLTNLIQHELNEDFVAIKIGDVNLNAMASINSNPNEDLAFLIGQPTTTADGMIELAVKAKNHNNISAWQLDLFFDKDKMSFEGIHQEALPNINQSNTGERFLQDGILPMVWINPSGEANGLTIEDGTVLFKLRFKSKTNEPFSEKWLGTVSNRIQKAAFRNHQPLNVDLLFEEKISERVPTWEVSNFYPNPFSFNTTIEFTLPENDEVQLQVFDAHGKMVYTKPWTSFAKGKNKVELNETFLPSSGVYYYRLRTTQNQTEGKIIYTK